MAKRKRVEDDDDLDDCDVGDGDDDEIDPAAVQAATVKVRALLVSIGAIQSEEPKKLTGKDGKKRSCRSRALTPNRVSGARRQQAAVVNRQH